MDLQPGSQIIPLKRDPISSYKVESDVGRYLTDSGFAHTYMQVYVHPYILTNKLETRILKKVRLFNMLLPFHIKLIPG